MKVPLSKPFLDQETRDVVLKALESGQYILGPECKAFESEFGAFMGTPQAVLTNSGTAAIQLALEAMGVRPGDEIIVPSLTAFPTVEPLLHLDIVPVFAEIDDSFTMNPDHVASLVSPRTVGILPVHLYGHPANLPALEAIARKHKLFILEDVCQAHGAEIQGKRCGSWGVAGCFSFYPSKNMTVAGDGGMLTTADAGLAEKVRMLRNHGRKGRYEHELVGYNLRFNEIQAAVGRIQLKHLSSFIEGRRAIAQRYHALLTPLIGSIKLPAEQTWAKHAYHLYVIRTKRRDELKNFLAAQGVATEIHYPIPCHLQPATKSRMKTTPMPMTEQICNEILSLPMFPSLQEADLAHVAAKVAEFFGARSASA